MEEVNSGHVTMQGEQPGMRWGAVGEAVFHVLGAVISFAWLPKEEIVIFSGAINPPPSLSKSVDLSFIDPWSYLASSRWRRFSMSTITYRQGEGRVVPILSRNTERSK